MQLILNPETDIDIQRKMSVIEQETFEENFKIKNVTENLHDDVSNIHEHVSPEQNAVEECVDVTKAENHKIVNNSENISDINVENEVNEDLSNENSNNELNDQCKNGITINNDSDNIEHMEIEKAEDLKYDQEKCEDVEMIDLQIKEKESDCELLTEDSYNADNNEAKQVQNDIEIANTVNMNVNILQNKDDNMQECAQVVEQISSKTDSNDLQLTNEDLNSNSEDLKSAPVDSLKLDSNDLKSDSEERNIHSEDLKINCEEIKINSEDLKINSEELEENSEERKENCEDIKSDSKELTIDSDTPNTESGDQNLDLVNAQLAASDIKSDLNDLNTVSEKQKLDPSSDKESLLNSVENCDIINISDEKVNECKSLEAEEKEKSDTLLESESKITEELITNATSDEISAQSTENNEKETTELQKDLSEDKEVTTLVENKNETTVTLIDNNNQEDVKENIPSSNISNNSKALSHICKLSNTLDILSDEDEEESANNKTESQNEEPSSEKQCIQIEDDDDIMLIDDDSNTKSDNNNVKSTVETATIATECEETKVSDEELNEEPPTEKDTLKEDDNNVSDDMETEENSKNKESTPTCPEKPPKPQKPLLPLTFLKTCKKNLVEMTRNELEEFCILKIVESVVDRSNLNEIKTQLKVMAQNIEEYKKKAMLLTKQNRDLQVVLKSVQEEQKKRTDLPITPLKITRSVGMQVFMTDKSLVRKKSSLGPNNLANSGLGNSPASKQSKGQINLAPKPQKPQVNINNTQQIPVPRLVPASNTKSPNTNSSTKPPSTSTPNGVKNSPPVQKPVKRPSSKIGGSVTVDLTDDEPPAKVIQLNINPPVRLVPPQNLLAPQRQSFGGTINSPRKVYIPISGAQNQVRAGQTIMLKPIVPQGPRQKGPQMIQKPNNSMRMTRIASRHPAPLPDCMKQYQPPNWKALPPAPELKLSKVENGIVISWKIDGYQEENHEEIASYQLYAYQETSSPPSTALWKKIGDVKALPLPMACTLTQFMAGYKYYFAVRAVDVRSRLGPFSTPGSILLLNKM